MSSTLIDICMGKKKSKTQVPTASFAGDKLKFSFEFYDTDNDEYCISKWDQAQIRRTLTYFKDVSIKSINDLRRGRQTYHFSEVIWEKTIKRQGFPIAAANNLPPYHLALVGVNGQKARVYGALYTNIFYIIWFDLKHLIWPTPLKNT